MTDENNRLQEERQDAVLELLMEEYTEIEGEALWREFQAAEAARQEAQTQQREDRGSGKGSGGMLRRIDTLKCIGNAAKRVAIVFLVLIVLLSPVIMSADAFRLPVLNYIFAIRQKFSGFNFGVDDERMQKDEDIVELIRSVTCPDGYHFSGQEISPKGKKWVFLENEEKNLIGISVCPPDGQFNIDTEDVNQIPISILDYEATYLQKEGHRIVWMDAERQLVFSVHAYDLEDEPFWRYVYRLAEKLSQ